MPHSQPTFIHPVHAPNLVLDVAEGAAEGHRVIVWEKKYSDNQNQQWVFTHDGFIASQADHNLVLDVKDHEESKDGAQLIVWSKKNSDNANQKWNCVPDGFIYNQGSGMVLDVTSASKTPGTPLIVWHKNHDNNAHQRFTYTYN